MFDIIKVAATVVGGPLGGVVGSIFEQITNLGKGGKAQDPTQILESAIQSLSQFQGGLGGAAGATPLPFSNPAANSGNAAASFDSQRDQINQLMGQIQKLLEQLAGQNAGGIGAAAGSSAGSIGGDGSSGGSGIGGASGTSGVGGGDSGLESMVDSVGSSIDGMMSQAEGLMKSDKQSDQLKGQMMMQKAMRLFEMISKLLEQRSQMASKAIQGIK